LLERDITIYAAIIMVSFMSSKMNTGEVFFDLACPTKYKNLSHLFSKSTEYGSAPHEKRRSNLT